MCRAQQALGDATPAWGGETPSLGGGDAGKKGRSRWDETPANLGGATPSLAAGITPGFFTG